MQTARPTNLQPLSRVAPLLGSRKHANVPFQRTSLSLQAQTAPWSAHAAQVEPRTPPQELPMTEELARRLREAGL
jgi:hypothetical protein